MDGVEDRPGRMYVIVHSSQMLSARSSCSGLAQRGMVNAMGQCVDMVCPNRFLVDLIWRYRVCVWGGGGVRACVRACVCTRRVQGIRSFCFCPSVLFNLFFSFFLFSILSRKEREKKEDVWDNH